MKIIALVGSLRNESFNMQLTNHMKERYQDKITIEIADIKSLPYFDQDEELNPPQVVKVFKESIAHADGVLVATPEFNWSIPGVLKNALDWTSRVEKVFIGKPVMVVGATPGAMGTIRAQLHLRDILSSPGIQAKLLPPGTNEVLVNFAAQKFDPTTGRLIDEATLNFLDEKVNNFITFIEEVKASTF